jgi:hypothetical protein
VAVAVVEAGAVAKTNRVTGDARAFAIAAIEVVTAVSKERLRSAIPGEKVCVPVHLMRELERTIEHLYPGVIKLTRELRG